MMLQLGFCAQVLKHTTTDHKATFIERVTRMEGAWEVTNKDQALVEHECSTIKEAHQTLVQELDSLSTRNNDLQSELEATYQEVVMPRRGNPRLLECLQGLSSIKEPKWKLAECKAPSIRGSDGCNGWYPTSPPYPVLVNATRETGKKGSCNQVHCPTLL